MNEWLTQTMSLPGIIARTVTAGGTEFIELKSFLRCAEIGR